MSGLRRIPGSKHYQADPGGLRAVGASSAVGREALRLAQAVASQAGSTGQGSYEAVPAPVRGGWDNEERAGAIVRESTVSLRDRKGRVLLGAAGAPALRQIPPR